VTSVALLDRAGQVHEIARMLAGEQVTEAALHHAVEMIEQAAQMA
jgi:DNA repair ATPase RecN